MADRQLPNLRTDPKEPFWPKVEGDKPPETFKEWKKRRKLTNFNMAVATGVSIHTYKSYDDGRSKCPTYDTRQKIKAIYPDCPLATHPALRGLDLPPVTDPRISGT